MRQHQAEEGPRPEHGDGGEGARQAPADARVRGTKGPKARLAVTAAGTEGLALVTPTGQIEPGLLTGPTPPGAAEPVEVAGSVTPPTGSGTPTGK